LNEKHRGSNCSNPFLGIPAIFTNYKEITVIIHQQSSLSHFTDPYFK